MEGETFRVPVPARTDIPLCGTRMSSMTTVFSWNGDAESNPLKYARCRGQGSFPYALTTFVQQAIQEEDLPFAFDSGALPRSSFPAAWPPNGSTSNGRFHRTSRLASPSYSAGLSVLQRSLRRSGLWAFTCQPRAARQAGCAECRERGGGKLC